MTEFQVQSNRNQPCVCNGEIVRKSYH